MWFMDALSDAVNRVAYNNDNDNDNDNENENDNGDL